MAKSRTFAAKSGQNISSSLGVTKSRTFVAESGQNIFSSVGVTKSRAFAAKSGQNISSSVEVTKSRAFAAKSGQNCTNLLSKQYFENYLISLSIAGIILHTAVEIIHVSRPVILKLYSLRQKQKLFLVVGEDLGLGTDESPHGPLFQTSLV